ncbi:MAG: hypothetical protein QOH17_4398 [Pseudonocardiales bacterium]|nr:hypothetical protein [Pseudonocardiales bacterium]
MTEPLWRDLTHQQVWEQVHAGPGPYVSDGAATAWSNAQAALRQIDSDLGAAITKAAGWTGPAADATRSGLTPLGGWVVDATGSAGRAAASLTEHQVQVAWVRANLPEPSPAPAIEPPIPLSDAGVDPAVLQNWTVTVGRNTALADQAFHVMETYATNTALIQQQVPTWTPPPAVTMSVGDRASGPATAAQGRRVGRFPTTVAPAAARVPTTGRSSPPPRVTSSSADALAPAAPDGTTAAGAVAGGVLPAGPGVVRGLPDSAGPAGGVVPATPTARPDTARPNTAPPSPGRGTPGVLRGLPNEEGVLRGGPSTTLGSPFRQGSPIVGRPELGTGALGGGQPGDPRSAIRGDPAAAGPGRSTAERSPGYLPMGGGGLSSRGDTHRRPDYLVDTYAFFVDDRHIQGPLITPELHPRRREASIG